MNNEQIPSAWHVADAPAPVKKPKTGNRKTAALVLSIIAGVLVLAAAGFGVFALLRGNGGANGAGLFATEPPKEFTFPAGTKVSGLDISGKTVPQAKQYLEKYKGSLADPVVISIGISGNKTSLTQDDFEYTYNIDEVVDKMKADIENPVPVMAATQGTTAEATGDSAEVFSPQDGYRVQAKVTEESIEKNVRQLCEAYNTEPLNASVKAFHPFASTRFEFEEAANGFTIDDSGLKTQLAAALKSRQPEVYIEAATMVIEPDVTVDYLKKNIVQLSTYQTYSTNTENATNNMKVSLAACNGSTIAPGEIWSFNDCTGDSNLESNGYKSANVISDGKLTQGIGGGICQSSSTIYNAAIRANLGIYERANHKWASSYVPTGLDATIDYGNIDLKLSNNSDHTVYLECKLDGSTLTASFWGIKSGEFDSIKTRNSMGEQNKDNYTVHAWRVYYKDGKKVGEEALPDSNYDSDNGVSFYSADGD